MEEIIHSFEYGIPAAIIVAIYLIISKIIDSRKEKRKVDINQSLVESFTKLNDFLDYFTKDIIEKEKNKCEFAIKTAFTSFANAIVEFSINTIINNNIDNNREAIIDNIQTLVSTEYWNIYSCFSLYKANNINVTEYLDTKWKDEIIEDVTTIIFNTKKSKEKRIFDINNKIRIDVNSYYVHVINRYGKDK